MYLVYNKHQKDSLWTQRTHYGLESGRHGFIETLHKQEWSLQHCLRPLAYTWAEFHFQIYHNESNELKGKTITVCRHINKYYTLYMRNICTCHWKVQINRTLNFNQFKQFFFFYLLKPSLKWYQAHWRKNLLMTSPFIIVKRLSEISNEIG